AVLLETQVQRDQSACCVDHIVDDEPAALVAAVAPSKEAEAAGRGIIRSAQVLDVLANLQLLQVGGHVEHRVPPVVAADCHAERSLPHPNLEHRILTCVRVATASFGEELSTDEVSRVALQLHERR